MIFRSQWSKWRHLLCIYISSIEEDVLVENHCVLDLFFFGKVMKWDSSQSFGNVQVVKNAIFLMLSQLSSLSNSLGIWSGPDVLLDFVCKCSSIGRPSSILLWFSSSGRVSPLNSIDMYFFHSSHRWSVSVRMFSCSSLSKFRCLI